MATPQPQAKVVMHLIDTGGPGGAETLFSQFASRITPGVTTTPLAVVPREHWLSQKLRTLNIEPLILEARGSLNLSYLKKLVGLVSSHRVQLIHTHLLGSAVYGGLAGLMTGRPVIAVFHGPTDLRKPGRFATLKRQLIKLGCTEIVAVSSSTQEALIEFGISKDLITLIPNGVDTDLYVPGHSTDLRAELNLPATASIVGSVGNIRAPKAYDDLLRAASHVIKEVPHAHFVVVGDGDEEKLKPLLQIREALGLEAQFHFLGFRKNEPRLYHNLDLFASSSRSEGLSLAFLEAMATARAIVATRSGGPQEAVQDGVSALLVPVGDSLALAAALIRALKDEALRARLGNAARDQVVARYSLARVLEKYASLYDKHLK